MDEAIEKASERTLRPTTRRPKQRRKKRRSGAKQSLCGELAGGGLVARVGQDREIHQRRQERGQVVRFASVQAREEDRFDPADDAGGGDRRGGSASSPRT